MNIRVFVLYWDKSPPPVPAINGFPQRGKDTVRGLISCCYREWTFKGRRLVHLGSIFRYQNGKRASRKLRFEFDSSLAWCFVCGEVQLWNKEVQRGGVGVSYTAATPSWTKSAFKGEEKENVPSSLDAITDKQLKSLTNTDPAKQFRIPYATIAWKACRMYTKVCVHAINTILDATQRAMVSWTGTH